MGVLGADSGVGIKLDRTRITVRLGGDVLKSMADAGRVGGGVVDSEASGGREPMPGEAV